MTTSSPVESDIKYELVKDGKIIVYHIGKVDRDYADRMAVVVHKIMSEWPREKPYLCAFNVIDPKIIMTPYIRSKLKEFTDAYPDLAGKAAAVIPGTPMAHAVRMYMMLEAKKYRQRRTFFTLEEAIEWLLQE
jgi:hypothetical protein